MAENKDERSRRVARIFASVFTPADGAAATQFLLKEERLVDPRKRLALIYDTMAATNANARTSQIRAYIISFVVVTAVPIMGTPDGDALDVLTWLRRIYKKNEHDDTVLVRGRARLSVAYIRLSQRDMTKAIVDFNKAIVLLSESTDNKDDLVFVGANGSTHDGMFSTIGAETENLLHIARGTLSAIESGNRSISSEDCARVKARMDKLSVSAKDALYNSARIFYKVDSDDIPRTTGCDYCKQTHLKLMICSKCHHAKYCCAEHQKLDWKNGHKANCRAPTDYGVGDRVCVFKSTAKDEYSNGMIAIVNFLCDEEGVLSIDAAAKHVSVTFTGKSTSTVLPRAKLRYVMPN